jgi:predicted MFS family arabinose efflux permease
MPLLLILAAGCFVSSMSMRVIDPIVPGVARDLGLSVTSVALLASAFTFPYALGQPVLGALGDALGKARIIKITLAVLTACLAACALAPSLDWLMWARILGGAAGGGVIPLAFALVGDRFDIKDRQVALSRVLMAIITGQMTGTVGSGLVASIWGWRVSMAAGAVLAGAALILTLWQLHPRPHPDRPPVRMATFLNGYGDVFRNPRSAVCFAAVFVEGIVVFGAIPYLAVILEQRGAGGVREAGFVLAGFAIGGMSYVALVRWMLSALGLLNLIRAGGAVCGLGFAALAFDVSWPVSMAIFGVMGIGFYMIHNSVQTLATELAPDNRGSAVAAHAFFFFLGQAAGPVVYGLTLPAIGASQTLAAGALAMTVLGFATAYGLIFRTQSVV